MEGEPLRLDDEVVLDGVLLLPHIDVEHAKVVVVGGIYVEEDVGPDRAGVESGDAVVVGVSCAGRLGRPAVYIPLI